MAKIFTITEGLENMGALKTGGQGSVYKGRRIGEIITAIKLLPTPIHSETPDDKHFTDFQNEVAKLKKVNKEPNPNVVKILSSGITETGSLPFIEMEYVEGPDLEELVKPPHPSVFTVKEAVKVADQLSHALAHCHRVDVKHGDIKSNNVKLNIHTANYVLLDFGLAIMSDEQRRSSLRHAGAIEFMAPEQNEGLMLFQTDVYSFGVILFELLAGQVPFPLSDNGETSRNAVMLAHLETPPPDIYSLRKKALPASWTEEKKEREMHLPEWLTASLYKCLEKKPQNRFTNGAELHEFITSNSIRTENKNEQASGQVKKLRLENERLLQEKEELQQQLFYYQQQEVSAKNRSGKNSRYTTKNKVSKKGIFRYGYLLLFLLGISVVVFALIKNRNAASQKDPVVQTQSPKRIIGQYKVLASRAYFHNRPDESTKRIAYLIPSNDVVAASDEQNNFIYTEFTNSKGQTSKGWVRKTDLITLEQWTQNSETAKAKPRLTQEDVFVQLADARILLANNEFKEALYIYSYLAGQEIPEAMYEYGNLGLQKKNGDIECQKALDLVKKASDRGYAPAKRTLGFLYLFADNKDILGINDYEQCTYERNVFKGSRLLMEAVLKGDTTAKKILDQLNVPSKNKSIPAEQ